MPLFRIRRRYSLQKSLRRLFTVLIDRVEKELTLTPVPPTAVHESRKSVKRLRALVSLVAADMGDEASQFDRTLRDINRTLSATRDASVALTTLDHLALAAGDGMASDFAVCRAALDRRLAHLAEQPLDIHREVLTPLQRLQRRWKKWDWQGDEWTLLEPNLRRTYRDGRRMYREITLGAPAEVLHDLRKRVKATQYHVEFLIPLAPQRMQPEHDDWERLADVLGNHHDLWVLEGLIQTTSGKDLPRATRGLILGETQAAARQLERQIARLAPIVYAERPKAFTARIGAYWQIWRTRQDD